MASCVLVFLDTEKIQPYIRLQRVQIIYIKRNKYDDEEDDDDDGCNWLILLVQLMQNSILKTKKKNLSVSPEKY